MVLGVIDTIINLANEIFSNLLPLPEMLTGSIADIVYLDYAFIGGFLIVLLLSRFLKVKYTLIMLGIFMILSFVVGGAYFTSLVFLVQLPLMVVLKITKKKKDDMGGDLGGLGDLGGGKKKGKKGKDDLGDVGGLGDLGGDKDMGLGGDKSMDLGMELPKEEKIPEPSVEIAPLGQPQQKLCPYCSGPLTYMQQYKRYYCNTDKRWI